MAHITAAHFLAGTIGAGLLRHWYVDGDVNDTRMSELRQLLDQLDEFPYSWQLDPIEDSLTDGYAAWADDYDGPNPLIEAEEPVVHPILADLAHEGAAALDAACGTGRHARFLHTLGCEVVGVDRSDEMLNAARAAAPSIDFRTGDLTALPFDDATFDIATVSLALCHLADPTAAVGELARVLRPGGHLVVSDPHPAFGGALGGQAFYGGLKVDAPMRFVRNHYHGAELWFSAFRAAGLDVQQCLEPVATEAQLASSPAALLFADAHRAAAAGLPGLWVWVARRPG